MYYMYFDTYVFTATPITPTITTPVTPITPTVITVSRLFQNSIAQSANKLHI